MKSIHYILIGLFISFSFASTTLGNNIFTPAQPSDTKMFTGNVEVIRGHIEYYTVRGYIVKSITINKPDNIIILLENYN